MPLHRRFVGPDGGGDSCDLLLQSANNFVEPLKLARPHINAYFLTLLKTISPN